MAVESAAAKNPVVLVHGIWNTASIFSPLRAYLERSGWQTYALSMCPNNGDAPLELLAEQVCEFVAEQIDPQQPFDLVGFSMGGLISRYYVQRLGGLARVQRFVTVSAPHQGTVLGAFSRRYGIRQMRPGSPLIKSLNQDIHQLNTLTFSSLWTPFDLLILPPRSSDLQNFEKMEVRRSHKLRIPAHNRMIRDQEGLEAIARCLSL